MLVYVLNKNKKPLMPCKPQKARNLLNQGKAKVVKTEPFTIQLICGSSGYKQNIILGVDAGSKHIGISASTENKELYAADVELRNDITELLSTRRETRRTRRNRKTRYRMPRFKNRKRPDGWITPSVQAKIDTHLKVINDVHRILPITKIIVETASFDIQKMQNPNIQGTEYQQGNQLGFWNVREYVLFRDNHTCQCCKGKSKDKILNVHHIESRKTGGNAPNNLITLCKTCHTGYHKGTITLPKNIKRGASYKDATFMGIMRWFFYNELKKTYPDVHMTFGYITKNTRIKNNLIKEHYVDALCIAGHPKATQLNYYYYQKQVRRNNRQIHKANILKGNQKRLNQAPKYIKGFQLFDKVMYKGDSYYIFGRRNSGYFDIRKLDGTKVNKGSVNCKYLRKLESRETTLTEKRSRSPLMTKVTSLRTA